MPNRLISGDQTTNIYGNMNLSVMKSIKTKISEDSTYESYGVTTITSQDNLYLKSSTNVDIAKEYEENLSSIIYFWPFA